MPPPSPWLSLIVAIAVSLGGGLVTWGRVEAQNAAQDRRLDVTESEVRELRGAQSRTESALAGLTEQVKGVGNKIDDLRTLIQGERSRR